MLQRSFDEFDVVAEREAESMKTMQMLLGQNRGSSGGIGGRHVRRRRNLQMSLATPNKTRRMAEIGVL